MAFAHEQPTRKHQSRTGATVLLRSASEFTLHVLRPVLGWHAVWYGAWSFPGRDPGRIRGDQAGAKPVEPLVQRARARVRPDRPGPRAACRPRRPVTATRKGDRHDN